MKFPSTHLRIKNRMWILFKSFFFLQFRSWPTVTNYRKSFMASHSAIDPKSRQLSILINEILTISSIDLFVGKFYSRKNVIFILHIHLFICGWKAVMHFASCIYYYFIYFFLLLVFNPVSNIFVCFFFNLWIPTCLYSVDNDTIL